MELAGKKNWSPPLDQGLKYYMHMLGDPKEASYEKLINYNPDVISHQYLSVEEIEDEVRQMTENCSTCGDH
jgi:hypothetical protein